MNSQEADASQVHSCNPWNKLIWQLQFLKWLVDARFQVHHGGWHESQEIFNRKFQILKLIWNVIDTNVQKWHIGALNKPLPDVKKKHTQTHTHLCVSVCVFFSRWQHHRKISYCHCHHTRLHVMLSSLFPAIFPSKTLASCERKTKQQINKLNSKLVLSRLF